MQVVGVAVALHPAVAVAAVAVVVVVAVGMPVVMRAVMQVVGVAVGLHPAVVVARRVVARRVVAIRRSGAGQAPTSRRSSGSASDHSGTLPCLRRGNSSRLVASIRSPATSFWRVSAGSITSSM